MARILFLTERFPPDIGGLAASSARISQCLASLGFDIDVVAWSRHVPAGKLVEQKIDAAPENFTLYRHGLYRQWDMSMPATLNVLDWLHSEHKYDLVWGHYLSPAGFLAVWFAQLNSIKSTVSARGNDIDTAVFPPGDLARLTWTLDKANLVSSVSEDIAKKIKVICGRTDVEVLANAVDTETFADRGNSTDEQKESLSTQADKQEGPLSIQADKQEESTSIQADKRKESRGIQLDELKASLGIQADELVLAFAGELREKKGIQFLLESFRKVREQRPCCLLVIGDVRSHQRPAVQLFAAEFPADAERLIITGHIEDRSVVAAHLRLCDIYLQPSLMEGMPNSLLEAMACSRLCIASDAGGIPELIEHGKNGFILQRAQLNHLDSAILEALELDAEQKQQICSAARQTVLDRFSLERERAQLAELLKRLLNNSEYAAHSNEPVRSKV